MSRKWRRRRAGSGSTSSPTLSRQAGRTAPGAELALHVLEVAEAAVEAVATRTVVDVPPLRTPS